MPGCGTHGTDGDEEQTRTSIQPVVGVGVGVGGVGVGVGGVGVGVGGVGVGVGGGVLGTGVEVGGDALGDETDDVVVVWPGAPGADPDVAVDDEDADKGVLGVDLNPGTVDVNVDVDVDVVGVDVVVDVDEDWVVDGAPDGVAGTDKVCEEVVAAARAAPTGGGASEP